MPGSIPLGWGTGASCRTASGSAELCLRDPPTIKPQVEVGATG